MRYRRLAIDNNMHSAPEPHTPDVHKGPDTAKNFFFQPHVNQKNRLIAPLYCLPSTMFAIVLGKYFTKPFALRQMQRFDPPDHAVLNLVFWSFEFVSDFEFRASDFIQVMG